ncbi:MAG: hypothetical protein OCD02_03400 [Spirochaetaceae bacterium]
MIKIYNTENLTGITIKGDYNDFKQLVDAFYEITIDEDDKSHKPYYDMSTRVLSLCYDIRHALQGDRELHLENNGVTKETMNIHSIMAPKYNAYFSCNYLYPEMLFVTLALNNLIEIRMKFIQKPKSSHADALNKMVIWDTTINTLRNLQSAFCKCIEQTLTPASFSRWIGIMNKDYADIVNINRYFIDLQNLEYLDMTKEIRLKKITSISKKLVEYRFNEDHENIVESVKMGAQKLGCPRESVALKGFEYPQNIKW